MIATATTKGVKVFDVSNGDLLAEISIPGMQVKQVELSYSDKQFLVLYEDKNRESHIRVFNLKDVLSHGKNLNAECPHVAQIKGPKDHGINNCKWGSLDKTILYCTDKGRLLKYDLVDKSVVKVKDVHRNEIFTMTITKDFTMLFTCSRDGTCKLLHPETFDEVRSYAFNFPCRNASVSPLYESEDN